MLASRRRFFTGTYPVNVDGQRRLTMPKGWRLASDSEDTAFYLIPGHKGRIYIATEERIDKIMDSIIESSVASESEMDSYTDIGSKIQEVVLDKQGRFALNQVLADFASITDRAIFLGSMVYGVIVSPANWEENKVSPSESSLKLLQQMEERHRVKE